MVARRRRCSDHLGIPSLFSIAGGLIGGMQLLQCRHYPAARFFFFFPRCRGDRSTPGIQRKTSPFMRSGRGPACGLWGRPEWRAKLPAISRRHRIRGAELAVRAWARPYLALGRGAASTASSPPVRIRDNPNILLERRLPGGR